MGVIGKGMIVRLRSLYH